MVSWVCGAPFFLLCLIGSFQCFTVRNKPNDNNGQGHAYAYGHNKQDRADDYYPVDEDACTMFELATKKMDVPNPPYLPPVGVLTNVGIDLAVRDHFLFEVKMCANAIIVLTSTSVPLAYPGYRVLITPEGDRYVAVGQCEDESSFISVKKHDADDIEMDCDTFQKFFITWSDTEVRFGKSWDYLDDDNVILKDNVSPLTIRYAGIGGITHDGQWRIAKDPVPEPNCGQADIAFAVDLSNSMLPEMLNKYALTFVVRLVKRLKIGPQDAQFSLVTFTADATISFKLNEIYDKDLIVGKTKDALGNQDWGTCLGCAMEKVKDEVFNVDGGARPGITHIFILISDGINNDIDSNSVAGPTVGGSNLKDNKIETYALGLAGNGSAGLDSTLLQDIAYNPDTHYLTIENENTLDEAIAGIRTRLGCA